MSNKQKELKREYKQNNPPMGVYQIRNLVNEKVFVGNSLNLPGIFNRSKLQLDVGSHPNKALQAEWKQYGGESFAFEVLDELDQKEALGYDYRGDLVLLEELWLEKLQPYGERGYIEKKKSIEEKLRQIAANRTSS
ncbi:MAG: GIY-YIG nuclease family protein [Acidobacteriota bacterium]